ncbi:MAG TPA: oligosaccharide flippase family protein [Vicinamibacterales bacterium]|jgi:O-antigen/teichoic acid export membrane protein
MSSDLKRFGRKTSTYTLGNFIYRGASFVLVPLYMRTLTPADFGILELITTIGYLVQTLISAGVAHAALRYYYEYEDERDRHAVISSALIGTFLYVSAAALIFALNAGNLSRWLFHSDAYALPFRLVALLMVLETTREINMAFVRAKERAGFFIVVSLLQLTVQISATVWTVVYLKLGFVGILWGTVAATACVWLLLTLFTARHCGLRFEPSRLRPLFGYAAPLMLSAMGWSTFQYLDRFVLNAFASLTALGLFSVALKVGSVIPILVVTPFTNSYGPFRFSIMKRPDAEHLYARTMTYYVAGAGLVTVALAGLSHELIRIAATPEYWGAAQLIPFAVIPGFFGGIQYCLQTGPLVRKETKCLFYIAIATGAVNIVLVLALVPTLGAIGAALAAVGSGIYGISHTYVVSQRFYPIAYEFKKLARIVGLGVGLVALAFLIPLNNLWLAIAVKSAIVACYPLGLFVLGVFTADERRAIADAWEQVVARLRGERVPSATAASVSPGN